MPTPISLDVLSAILAGSTTVRRRMEIYEADGATLWLPIEDSSRIIEGNVGVEYGRAERRSFDLTLDNSDGLLDHDPSGFWYDKVIKLYRGVDFRNTNTQPRIMFIRDQVGNQLAPLLRQIGYTDITDRTTNVNTLNDLFGYDLIVANSGTLAMTAGETALLASAQDAGFNILTVGSANTSTSLPRMIATTVAKATGGWTVGDSLLADTPFKGSWVPYSLTTGTAGDRVITVGATNVKSAAYALVSGANTFPALFFESNSGARWFHYQPRVITNENADVKRLFASAMNWLYVYDSTRAYETQIGEFLIDNIETPHFPDEVKVSGRDYAKRLVNTSFRNTLTFAAGTSIDTLLTSIAASAGNYKTLLDTGGAVVQTDASFEKGTSKWEAMGGDKSPAVAAGLEVFYDVAGNLVARKLIDPTTGPSSITLTTGGSQGNLASFNKKSTDSQVKNIVIVDGINGDDLSAGSMWRAIAENTQVSSPTSVAAMGPREYFRQSSFLKSNSDCLALAQSLLKVMALENFELEFNSLVFPWLEVGEIATFEDPNPNRTEPARYLLTSLGIPMGLGTMSGAGKRITIVGDPVTGG